MKSSPKSSSCDTLLPSSDAFRFPRLGHPAGEDEKDGSEHVVADGDNNALKASS